MMQIIEACRSCGYPDVVRLLDLGQVPLANALLSRADFARPESKFPLTLAFCPECSLVQIEQTIDPAVLFRDYFYLSSFSSTMLNHARKEAEMLVQRFSLDKSSLVVEIASNDGYLLKNFVALHIPVLGIEPAQNIARVAEAAGVPSLCEFFGKELAHQLRRSGRRADILLANNVLAHVADFNSFVEGVALLLQDTGCAVIEFPYLVDMIERVEFDTIYHEHLCYFSLHAVRSAFHRHGLVITDVQRLPIHGGSLRIYAQPEESAGQPAQAVLDLAEQERKLGITEAAYYVKFSDRVEELKRNLLAELQRRKAKGETLAAYGASAKGSTLMNTCGIGPETIDFIVDRSHVKQGHFTPGNHLPILPPEALLERRPDAVLLLTWNFADEILQQQAAYLKGGGEFIIPVPEVHSVGWEAHS